MINTKQQAFDLFENKRKEFLENCRWIAIRIAKSNNGLVNIDLVRDQVTTPDGVNPKVYGAVFNTDEFEKSGYTQTTRKTSHGRAIAIFYWKPYINWKQSQRPTSYENAMLF